MALDGVTNPKTQFLVTKSGPFWTARTDGTDAHTHRFLEPLYTISPSGNKQIMWKQGGGSADHDFYIALTTNNDSFKIWISEIETKKVGISF